MAHTVTPAKAGVQKTTPGIENVAGGQRHWIPASAGMTGADGAQHKAATPAKAGVQGPIREFDGSGVKEPSGFRLSPE